MGKVRIRSFCVTAALIVVNILVFLVVEFTGGSGNTRHMLNAGAAYAPFIREGEYYRLFTSMFLHFGIEHLLNNMLVLGVLGERLEYVLGHVRFLFLYLLGGIGGSLASYYLELKSGEDAAVSAGASGAVFALMGALIFLVIRNGGELLDLSFQRIVIMVALSIYLGFAEGGVDMAAHIGGMFTGFCLAMLMSLNDKRFQQKRR